jgi:hypothetical protein
MVRSQRPTVEVLDDRTLPAVYGMAWSDPVHLTLSFAPDGTPIAGHQSNLFQTLDAQEPRAVWEGDILRALETWAASTNLSVGVVADGGQPFGTPGLAQGNPHFGDIRIGAQPMSPDALAVSVPHDPFVAGRWAGTIFLNSAYNFTAPQADLYSVMLHEFGHVLGLDDSTDPNSVMYEHATAPVTQLAPGDVAAIQALYGAPAPDPYQGHDTLATAARLRSGDDGGANGSTPLVAFGDLRAAGSANVFSVRTPPTYQGPVTVRLLTAGVSLLEPRLTVFDAAGNVLGQAQSTNLLGDVLSVQLSQTSPGAVYYVRVDGAADGTFGVGRYGLAVTFDKLTTVTPAQVEAVLSGPFDTLNLGDVEGIFSNPQGVLFNGDGSGHSQFATAQALTTAAGYATGTHYQAIGSLNDSQGGDFYSLTAPAGAAGTPVELTATVGRMSVHGVDSLVQLYDAQQHQVAAPVLIDESGTYTIQAVNLTPGATYYLKVTVVAGESENGGNYSLVVDFQQPATLLPAFAAGTLSAAAPTAGGTLYVAQNQLFHFVLSVPSATAGNPGGAGSGTGDHSDDGTGGSAPAPAAPAAVEVQVLDSKGNVVFDLKGSPGGTSSGTAFLVPGAYTVRITMPPGAPAGPTDYQLSCASLTDPVGPALADPSLQPLYTQPNDPLHYTYPGGIVSASVYYWLAFASTGAGAGSSGSPGGSGPSGGAGAPSPDPSAGSAGAGAPDTPAAAGQGTPPAPPQGPGTAPGHRKPADGSRGHVRRPGHNKKPAVGSRGRARKPHHHA